MNVWALPGPARFLERVERSLREGVNVVARFPGHEQAGFKNQALTLLNDFGKCSVVQAEPAEDPFDSLCRRFGSRLSRAGGENLLDLCEQEGFKGRLIWIDGLEQLDPIDWRTWRKFLADYAQASRSMREFERTLFVVSLEGVPPAEPPDRDVTLTTHDWRGVVGEMDLLFLAYERLGERNVSPAMRSLLAATVARVASWDLETAERMLDEKTDVILEPIRMLQSVACEKGWTTQTSVGWEFCTESGAGSRHAALASLDDPPREIRRRLWSAQVAELLPLIDARRYEIVQEHRVTLGTHLRSDGDVTDPLDLDVGRLKGMVLRPGFNAGVKNHVERLHRWRNSLSHLELLSLNAMRSLTSP